MHFSSSVFPSSELSYACPTFLRYKEKRDPFPQNYFYFSVKFPSRVIIKINQRGERKKGGCHLYYFFKKYI